MKGLFHLNGPHGSLSQLCPFHHRPRHINNVLHRPNVGEAVFDKRGGVLVHVPRPDWSDFERRTKPVHEQTNGFPGVHSTEQLHHGERLGLPV